MKIVFHVDCVSERFFIYCILFNFCIEYSIFRLSSTLISQTDIVIHSTILLINLTIRFSVTGELPQNTVNAITSVTYKLLNIKISRQAG